MILAAIYNSLVDFALLMAYVIPTSLLLSDHCNDKFLQKKWFPYLIFSSVSEVKKWHQLLAGASCKRQIPLLWNKVQLRFVSIFRVSRDNVDFGLNIQKLIITIALTHIVLVQPMCDVIFTIKTNITSFLVMFH